MITRKDKIILTMTTIPERLDHDHPMGLKRVIYSLLNQNWTNYEIHFNIPKVSQKTQKPYNIPSWLKTLSQKSNLRIFPTEDYGSITKLYPTLKRIVNPEQVIITVDDDLVYESRMIEEHVRLRNENDDVAWGFAGLNNIGEKFKDARDRFVIGVNDNVRVGILEHYKSVSYKRKMFGEDFNEDFIKKGWADDQLISAYMGSKGIKKIVASTDYIPKHKNQDEWRLYGVVESFPVICHSHTMSRNEGCNIWRNEKVEHLFDKDLQKHLSV